MTTPDMFIKGKYTDQGVFFTDRTGAPILRCLGHPKQAMKRLKVVLDAVAQDKETK